jgi:hypothetical protein
MEQSMSEVADRVSALLEELIDLLKPEPCDDPECDHAGIPEGPWMISGWALAVDLTAEGDDGEVDTDPMFFRSKNLPRTQCCGLGKLIMNASGL